MNTTSLSRLKRLSCSRRESTSIIFIGSDYDWIDPQTRALLNTCDEELPRLIQARFGSYRALHDRQLDWPEDLKDDPATRQPDRWIKETYGWVLTSSLKFLGPFLPQTRILLRKALTVRRLAMEQTGGRPELPGLCDCLKENGDFEGPEWSDNEEIDYLMEGKSYEVKLKKVSEADMRQRE